MKRLFLLSFVSFTLLYSCKKNDVSDSMISQGNKPAAPGNLTTRVVTSNLNFPWEILWGPDNFIWMTLRQGSVKRVNPQTGEVIHVATIPDVASTTNFNGLLGMVLHPQFATHPY